MSVIRSRPATVRAPTALALASVIVLHVLPLLAKRRNVTSPAESISTSEPVSESGKRKSTLLRSKLAPDTTLKHGSAKHAIVDRRPDAGARVRFTETTIVLAT